MNIKIQSIHFDADQKLLNFIEEKLNKLGTYSSEIIGAEVFLRLDGAAPENKIAEIRLFVPGNDHFAKRQCKSFEEAVAEAVDALRRQIRKRKEKALPEKK